MVKILLSFTIQPSVASALHWPLTIEN